MTLADQIAAVIAGDEPDAEKETAIMVAFESAMDGMVTKAVADYRERVINTLEWMKSETVGNSPWLAIDKIKAKLAELE